MYFPQEGIFGVTLWVVSTIVFHFVLFGVIAQRTGLGQLFIDNATILAGRYTGGPAKGICHLIGILWHDFWLLGG